MLFVMDIACIATIICFIRMMYQVSYKKPATFYFENQFGIVGASSISCTLVLHLYYFIENKYGIDAAHTKGLLLTIALMLGGLLSNLIYKHYFYLQRNKYQPTDAEYLFMTSVALLSISLRMVVRGIIDFTIPITILLGRYVWLDTRSIKEIKNLLIVQHRRVVESSFLLFVGLVLSSSLTVLLDLSLFCEVLISLIYGLLVLFPYRYIRNWIRSK